MTSPACAAVVDLAPIAAIAGALIVGWFIGFIVGHRDARR